MDNITEINELFNNLNVLVVIPTYNNEETIQNVINDCKKFTDNILVVNDGSIDQTPHNIKKAKPKFIINHGSNSGKGSAIKSSLHFAKENNFKTIITFDADGQHIAEELTVLIRSVQKNPDSIIIGARKFSSQSSGDIPNQTLLGNSFSNFWVFMETGLKLKDTQSGFRAYPVLKIPFEKLTCNRYDFEIEILTRSNWEGTPVISSDVEVFYPPRHLRVSHFNKIKDNFLLSIIHTKLCTIRILYIISFGIIYSGHFKQAGERKGSHILHFFMKYGGQKISYLIALFPLLFYFFTGKIARLGLKELYKNLGNKNHGIFTGFKNFWYFGCSLIDRMATINDPEWGSKVLSVKDEVRSMEDDLKGGSILIGAHYGDWFFCGLGLAQTELSIALVVDLGNTPIFQGKVGLLNNKELKIIDSSRDAMEVVFDIKNFIDDGGCVCFLADRAGINDKTIDMNFLGEEATFSLAPFEIARIFKKNVYQFSCCKKGPLPHSPYELKVIELWDGVENRSAIELSQLYKNNLEKWVRKKPYNWFNFYPFWKR
ncbi:MAG: glycosyltransferase family 2 protein [Deltaproteobacteria bacterium]|nr:glycosyltransferase family 2 protein [Deltaproteobacteria bacterium]